MPSPSTWTITHWSLMVAPPSSKRPQHCDLTLSEPVSQGQVLSSKVPPWHICQVAQQGCQTPAAKLLRSQLQLLLSSLKQSIGLCSHCWSSQLIKCCDYHACQAHRLRISGNKVVGSYDWDSLVCDSNLLPFHLFYSHIAPDVPLHLVVERGRLMSPFGFILDIYIITSIIG